MLFALASRNDHHHLKVNKDNLPRSDREREKEDWVVINGSESQLHLHLNGRGAFQTTPLGGGLTSHTARCLMQVLPVTAGLSVVKL